MKAGFPLIYTFCFFTSIFILYPISFMHFIIDTKIEVDRFYEKFKENAISSPSENKKYPIYHFFTSDPEGRMIEFQYFLSKTKEIIL
ncbi:MAG: hypothetical protein HQ534_00020 [Armatimonadetes bacterium]|nr:hypothetical protein [Armatimonadota bacterium]